MRKEVERKAIFCRIVAELQGRGYIVWFDCELVAPLLSVALLSCRTGSERTGVGGRVISMQRMKGSVMVRPVHSRCLRSHLYLDASMCLLCRTR